MERVTGMDAAFLDMETSTMHLHVVGVLVLDPGEIPVDELAERLRSVFVNRLHLIPPFRWRVVTAPGGLGDPRWVEDPAFDLARHLHRATSGPGADQTALERFVGELASRPLRRDQPLWETWLVDGFADGTVALITKVHHAIMDGAAGGDMMAALFDLEPEPGAGAGDEPPPFGGEPMPSTARLMADTVPGAWSRVSRLPGTVARTVGGLAGSAQAMVRQPAAVAGFAPGTSFNGPLTARRTVAFRQCALDDLKQVRAAFGTTINDVVLAATTSSLRSYVLNRGVHPDRPLVASVPVALERTAGDPGFGNRTSNIMVPLPVQLDDPVEALRSIHQWALGAKAVQQAMGPDLLEDLMSIVPGPMLTASAQTYSRLGLGRFHPPLFNAIVSNVPGPPIPLYLAGARVTATYPMGPLIANTALNLTVLSQSGDLDIGVIACPDLVDDVEAIAEGFIDGVAELREAEAAQELFDGRGLEPSRRAASAERRPTTRPHTLGSRP